MPKTEVVCTYCQKLFLREDYKIIESNRLKRNMYCSKECTTKGQIKKQKFNCRYCNKEIWRTPAEIKKNTTGHFFCSYSCSTKFNNNLKKKDIYCLSCNTILTTQKKYCNHACQREYEFEQYINRWKNGLESGLKGLYSISSYIRKYLFKKYNNKCAQCGWDTVNPFTNKIPLEVDHIDGNYKNNNEENLILLCPNCHSLTSTYKGANRNNGRINRK